MLLRRVSGVIESRRLRSTNQLGLGGDTHLCGHDEATLVDLGPREDSPRLVVGVMAAAVVALGAWGASRIRHEIRRHRA